MTVAAWFYCLWLPLRWHHHLCQCPSHRLLVPFFYCCWWPIWTFHLTFCLGWRCGALRFAVRALTWFSSYVTQWCHLPHTAQVLTLGCIPSRLCVADIPATLFTRVSVLHKLSCLLSQALLPISIKSHVMYTRVSSFGILIGSPDASPLGCPFLIITGI